MYDIVTLKSRTGKNEEFVSGGTVIVIDAKKGVKVPREFAELALGQNALKWDKGTGAVTMAKIYVEDDLPEGAKAPEKITEEEIKAIKRTNGIGSGKILVDGKFMNMTSIDLDPEA
jgi:hypothetical protein